MKVVFVGYVVNDLDAEMVKNCLNEDEQHGILFLEPQIRELTPNEVEKVKNEKTDLD